VKQIVILEPVDWNTPTRLSAKLRAIKGGPGSGNHDHAGRPGEVGGSAPKGAAVTERDQSVSNDAVDAWNWQTVDGKPLWNMLAGKKMPPSKMDKEDVEKQKKAIFESGIGGS